MYEGTLDFQCQHPGSALATVAGESCKSKFTAKIDFPIGYCIIITIADADIASLKSLYTLISIWTIHAGEFEQTRMVQTIQNFKLFDKKMVNHFWHHFGRSFCDWNNCLMLNF